MHASTSRPARLGPARLGAVVFAAVLAAGLLPATVAGVVGGGPGPNDRTASDQLVVRWADGSAGTAFGAQADAPSVGARPDRVSAVSKAAGLPATWLRTLAVGGDVYKVTSTLTPDEMASTMLSLRTVPGVVSAEPDGIAHADAAAPNDPCWPGSSPCADGIGQWDLREGTTAATYGIDLLGAWDRTRGAGVTVAVLDTGITTHPEFSGQTVAGYDFIADLAVANDGNGRDGSPADPGDNKNPALRSSWHGTHVTGTIGALTGNGVGMAGIAPQAKIQPVRVLGVGGGYYSDISDAMIWASGGAVSGVPTNATPSKVENLSLGGSGTCPSYMQSAVAGANARGTSIVVAAGNAGANLDVSSVTPASCSGVIPVAATTRSGGRASFSNYGSIVPIAAPGVSLWSTLNSGMTAPVGPTYAQYSGTSMASPHVAGVVALMIAVKPGLSPSAVRSLLQSTAHPFGSAGCSGCGAGIVDAARAVAAAAGATPSPTPTPRPSATPTPTSTAPTGCTRGTPSVSTTSSSIWVIRGFPATATLTLRNTDTAACGSSTFTWTVSATPVVTGFTATTPVSVTVNPGSSVSVTVTLNAAQTLPSMTRSTFTYRATRPASPTSGATSIAATAL